MLDIKKIRENGKQLDEALASRKHEASSSLIIDLDRKNRDLIGELQGLQEERNAKSKLIGEHASNGKKDEAELLKNEVSSIKDKMQELENNQRIAKEELNSLLESLPNIPDDSVPIGVNENSFFLPSTLISLLTLSSPIGTESSGMFGSDSSNEFNSSFAIR